MRRALLITGLLALVAVAVAAAGAARYGLQRPLALPQANYRVEVPAGSTLRDVTGQLAAAGVLRWPWLLNAYGRLTGAASRIRAGEYELSGQVTPLQLLDTLVEGRVLLHALTLVEGWSVAQILDAIRQEPALVHTLQARDPRALAAELGLGYPSAEGAFLPETYHFPRGTTDREILLTAHRAMAREMTAAWASRSPDTPLGDAYQMLILASIVEKETAVPAERPRIAGVFTRRLKLGMRLQTDPTVIYGLGADFDGNLTRRDLEGDTPWNTYTRDGLPPTPIAAPGADALAAAARPRETGALYFVATGDGSGRHRFSSTLDEHQAAIRDYHAALKSGREP